MTMFAVWLCIAGLGWMAGLLLLASGWRPVVQFRWPPITIRCGHRRPSTWRAVWQEAAR